MTPQFTKILADLCEQVKKSGDKGAGLLRHLSRALVASKDLEPKPTKKK